MTNSTWPNIRYHFEMTCGESPPRATVKAAPSEPYVVAPVDVKESEAPEVKSTLTERPRAESGGQLPVTVSMVSTEHKRRRTLCERVT